MNGDTERDDGWLETALRAAAPRAVDDDGFTARVAQAIAHEPQLAALAPEKALARLQARRRDERERLRYTVLGAVAGVVCAAALWGSGAAVSDLVGTALASLVAVTAMGWALVRSAEG